MAYINMTLTVTKAYGYVMFELPFTVLESTAVSAYPNFIGGANPTVEVSANYISAGTTRVTLHFSQEYTGLVMISGMALVES